MEELKGRFIDVLSESGVLLVGDFTLKSGEPSKFFFDFGAIPDGRHLQTLGECYADMIEETIGLDGFDVVFGPPYKGIPIATATVIALANRERNRNKRYAFNRKVEKDHGEGGIMLGSVICPDDRVLIVDDVFSDGAAKRETLKLLAREADPTVVAVVVGIDRSKPGVRETFTKTHGIPVHAICGMPDIDASVLSTDDEHGGVLRRRA